MSPEMQQRLLDEVDLKIAQANLAEGKLRAEFLDHLEHKLTTFGTNLILWTTFVAGSTALGVWWVLG